MRGKHETKKSENILFTPLTPPRGYAILRGVKGKKGLPDNLTRKERDHGGGHSG